MRRDHRMRRLGRRRGAPLRPQPVRGPRSFGRTVASAGRAGASGGSPSRPGRGAVGQTDVPPRSEVSASGGPPTTLPTVGLGVGPDPPGDRSASRHRGVFPVEHPHRQTHQAHTRDRLLELAAAKDWGSVTGSPPVSRRAPRCRTPSSPATAEPRAGRPARPGHGTEWTSRLRGVTRGAALGQRRRGRWPGADPVAYDGVATGPQQREARSARRGPPRRRPDRSDRHPPGGPRRQDLT